MRRQPFQIASILYIYHGQVYRDARFVVLLQTPLSRDLVVNLKAHTLEPETLAGRLERAALKALLASQPKKPSLLPQISRSLLRGLAPRQRSLELPSQARRISHQLIAEALANGLLGTPSIQSIHHTFASAGSTAEVVTFPSAEIKFAFKLSNDPALIAEAQALTKIRSQLNLPPEFAARFPRVYSSRLTDPPFAYLMEYFDLPSFEHHLFQQVATITDLRRITHSLLDTLLPIYRDTRNLNLKPNLAQLYLRRISDRLAAAGRLDQLFAQLPKKGITINGQSYPALSALTASVAENITSLECPFTTFAHGDLHPENILVAFSQEKTPDVRFIDVKAWLEADYLFDVGKLCHYLLVTGPVERLASTPRLELETTPDRPTVSYDLSPPSQATAVLEEVLARVADFAHSVADHNWRARYALSLASNLLGLPPSRIKNGKRDAALIYYCEGLRHLAACTSLMSVDSGTSSNLPSSF